MFATLFLGAVLAVFLTLSVVRGDAERGLLQPLVVRPIGREALLAGRFLAAAGVCSFYVAAVFASASGITYWAGGYWPDRFLMPALELAAAVVVIAALSILGSDLPVGDRERDRDLHGVRRGARRRLLGQIGEAIGSETLRDVAD